VAILIDTSVFIALERRKLPLTTLRHLIPGEKIALAAVTASELLVGVHRANNAERRMRRGAFVEAVLSATPVLAFDLTCARVHAGLLAELTSLGQRIGAHDMLIGATAIAYQHSVLTDNLRDFSRMPGLRAMKPAWDKVPALE